MDALAVFAALVMAVEPPKREKPEKPAEIEAPKPPPRSRIFFIPVSAGVSFPFSWGRSTRASNLNFEGPAFEWGLQCGVDFPKAEVRLSFDSRRYDMHYVNGTWNCDSLLFCGGWLHEFEGGLGLVLGGGLGVIWNSADRALNEPIDEDPSDIAVRLYSCIRYRPDWPLEIELYGRLTFASAAYETLGVSSTIDLSMGSVGFSALARF